MFELGAPELIIILIIILVIFAGSQLPKLARSLGATEKEVRKAMKDDASTSPSKATAKKSPKKSK